MKTRRWLATAGVVAMMAVAAAAGAGCSKDEAAPASGGSAAPGATSAVVATGSVSAGVYASPSVGGGAGAGAGASASASGSAGEGASAGSSAGGAKGTPAAPGSARGAATCGDKPLPPCPLYAWMKANTSTAMSAQDFDALAKALDKVVGFAPPGYTNWASISRDGAAAARAQSLDGVKASCRGCHNQYKDRYKRELRDRAI